MVNIIIAENIPTLNKGELALLKGMIESFRYLDKVKVMIVSSQPEKDKSRYGSISVIDVRKSFKLKNNYKYSQTQKILISLTVTIKHILFLIIYFILGERVSKIMKSEIWKAYLNSDFIFIGHNGIFGIGSGLIGNYCYILTFLSYLYLPFFGKILKKPLVIYGGSIPLYSSYFIRKWMSFLLNKIDLITLRESQSLKNLNSLNYTADKAYLTADLAFLMNPAPNNVIEKIIKLEGIKTDDVLIGVTVTRFKAISAYKNLSNDESYIKHSQMIADVLDYIIETKNAQIIFLPHSIGLEEHLDDRILSEHIFEKCSYKENIKVIKTEYSPEELKSLMGECDFFIGERLHSVIGAMSMKVPSLVLSNKSDMRLQIIRELGQYKSICYIDDLEVTELIYKIEEMWENREIIMNELEKQIQIAREKSMKNGLLLKELIS